MNDTETPKPKPKPKRKTRTTGKPQDGLPDRITTAQLRSPAELAELYRQYQGKVSEFDFFALACRAVRTGSNPPAVFRWFLHNDATGQLTIADDEQARQMLRANRSYRHPWLQQIVNKLMAGKRVPGPPTECEMEERRQQIGRYLEEIEPGCTR